MKKISTYLLITGIFFGVIAWLTPFAQADQMNYQGRLTDTNGLALTDGQYTLTFNVYTTASGGTAAWGPFVCDGIDGDGHAPKADLVNGRFNVILGPLDTDSDPITEAFDGGDRYLGITVGTNVNNELSPRQQVLAAPEAIHASEADFAYEADYAVEAEYATSAGTAANFTSVVLFTDEANGRVGIGTNSPTTDLDVAGDAKISGNTTVTGNLGVGTTSPTAKVDVVGAINVSSNATISGNVGIGTTNPGAKLQVNGDIKLGPSGQYQAVAAEATETAPLRIVRGTVNVAGTVISGSGFHTGSVVTGKVTLIFDPPFSDVPVVTGTVVGDVVGIATTLTIESVTSSTCIIRMYVPTVGSRNDPFNIIAIGQR
jgi:hypothetical protein